MGHMFFDKKAGSGVRVNEQLLDELHKPVIKKLKRGKIYARFIGNIWAVDLVKMGSLYSNIHSINRKIY